MSIVEKDICDYLAIAKVLANQLADQADRIARERRIPPSVATAMADAGLFRLLVPHSLGGAELDFLEYLKVVEIFAKADGSSAWCVNQNNVFATNSVRIPEATAQQVWSDPRTVITNGPPTPGSVAVPVEGGFILSGRWEFSSGIRHANWVAALAPIGQSDKNHPVMSDPTSGVVLIIPKEEVEVLDVWQVNGLRGTGSFSFAVDQLFVPLDRTYGVADPPREDGAIYLIPTVLMFAAGFATVALGIARSALDSAIEISTKKIPATDKTVLRESTAVQRQIGEAEAIWGSAQAFLREATADLWSEAKNDECLTLATRVKLRLAGTHSIQMAAQVVDDAYKVVGSGSVFESNPIQRLFQDVHVITQQYQGRMAHYETAGAFHLGLAVKGFF